VKGEGRKERGVDEKRKMGKCRRKKEKWEKIAVDLRVRIESIVVTRNEEMRKEIKERDRANNKIQYFI
jgi:curli biogenesis system outer membrane secretion channel CsgG